MIAYCVLCMRIDKVASSVRKPGTSLVKCETCGRYEVDDADLDLQVFEDPQLRPLLYRFSAITKASQTPVLLDKKRRDDLLAGVPRDKSVQEKIELLVRWVAKSSTEIGEGVQTVFQRDYPVAWCKSADEWSHLLKYLRTAGLLEIDSLNNPQCTATLTIRGWQWLDERPKATGSKAFIAMAFDPALDDVKAAIHRAIESAGYEPLRVDDDHYSGGVMDRIITQIRDSKFIVADFTKNKGGVYYEAGVAFGLGIDVVNVCERECLKEESKDRLHFDVRHQVFIPWIKDQLDKFSVDLANHIVALHGRGPRSRT